MNPFDVLSEPILARFPDLEPADLVYGQPPKPELGDVALRLFESAKKLKQSPVKIAATISEEVKFGPEVQGVSVTGPYLNFKLDRGVFGRPIVAQILAEGGRFGSRNTGEGQKVLVEHTSINPNASPHVGRARNAMIGDSLVRILRFEGYDVEVHYYVNDIGRQIALLVLACENLEDLHFNDMLEVYKKANARAKAEPEFAEQGYALLAQIEQGDKETRQRFRAVTDLCLEGQVAILGQLGIRYDSFDHESDYVKDPRLDAVLEALRAKEAAFTDEEGRLTVDLSKLGYPHDEGRYMALLRSNGSSMYALRDIAYTIDKTERGADLNLIVLGEDHKLHMQQIGLILDVAGKPAPEPVYYSYITLREGRMATRDGNVVLLSDFLDEATARAGEKVEAQWNGLDAEKQKAIAEQVAVSAIRFAILRVGANKGIMFDWESSLSFSGDTGPYVQYSCARISSILRKFGALPDGVASEFPVETGAEWALLAKLASFPDTVESAVRQRSCSPVAQFALETARTFTTFYHECPVLDAPTDAGRAARAQMCAATRTVLENALSLLGIDALERM